MHIIKKIDKTNLSILFMFFELGHHVEKSINKWRTSDHMAKNAYGNLKDLCKYLIKVLVKAVAEFLSL